MGRAEDFAADYSYARQSASQTVLWFYANLLDKWANCLIIIAIVYIAAAWFARSTIPSP